MDAQVKIRKLVWSDLSRIQGINPLYSMRSHARKIGIHPGSLSSFLNGKRNISKKMAEKILSGLKVDPQTRSEVMDLFVETVVVTEDSEDSSQYFELEVSTFKMIAEWEHFAILNLIRTKDFQYDTDWISKRLGISKAKTQEVLTRLFDLNLVKENKNGKLIRTKERLRTSDDIVNYSVQKSHIESIELARESLLQDDVDLRDFTSLTLPINIKKLAKAKEMIRKFQDDLAEVMESGTLSEVYRLNVQLYPLTKNNEARKIYENNSIN